jgi:hypothetical protein
MELIGQMYSMTLHFFDFSGFPIRFKGGCKAIFLSYIHKERVMAAIHFDRTDGLIDICRDNVFKAVFTKNTPASQGALSI